MKIHKKRIYSGFAAFAVLALALAPAGFASAETANTTVSTTVNSTLTITTGTTVALANLTPGASAVMSVNSDTVTVSTNNSGGFNLTLSNGDTDTDLDNASDAIAASANTYASPATLAENTWGYAVPSLGSFDASYSVLSSSTTNTAKFAGVPSSASPQQIKSTGTEAANDTTTVWYAARVNSSQPTGAYDDTVTYTALAN